MRAPGPGGRLRRAIASGALAWSLAVGVTACAAPPREPLAEAATAVLAGRSGVAPRWRAGEAASADEDERVRSLLARPLTEAGAVEVALIRNRSLQAHLEEAIAEGMAAYADAAPSNPVVDLVVRWPHGSGGPVVDAGLMFGLLDLLRSSGRSDAAGLAARAASLGAAQEITDAIGEVREAWIDAAAARERLSLDEDVAEAASIAADLAGRQIEAGTLSKLDGDRHRAFAEETFVARERSRAEAAAAHERLVRALGLFGEESRVTVPESLPRVPPASATKTDLERTAVGRRIDLERARVAVLRARLAAGMASEERVIPDLEAGVSYEREREGPRSTGPAVSFALPLSRREASSAEAARAAAREAEDRLFDLAARIRSEVREASAALRAADAVASRYADAIVPLRAATVEETQLLYNGMLVGVYDLLAEKREELRARREAADAVRDARRARVRLDLALGGAPLPSAAGQEPSPPPDAPSPGDAPQDHHQHGGR